MLRCLADSGPHCRCFLSIPALLFAGLLLAPRFALACACGCGVFEVGTSAMFPSGAGGTFFYGLDFEDQSRNWNGGHRAPSGNNDDKDLRTFFHTFGFQYMFNRSWGVQVEVPLWQRSFRKDVSGGNGPPDIVSSSWSSLGDIRIRGIYAGFSDDLSTGVTYGVKLPTGNFKFNTSVVDSDTQIGTGSTDILLGAFHRQALTTDNMWSWFTQAQLDVPVLIQNQYRPGSELDLAAGVHYNGWTVGGVQITPIAQAIVALRGRDSGANAASPVASGYQRLILAPGIQVDFSQFSVYADVELPVLESVNGNQLAAPVMFKLLLSYSF